MVAGVDLRSCGEKNPPLWGGGVSSVRRMSRRGKSVPWRSVCRQNGVKQVEVVADIVCLRENALGILATK